MTPYREHTEDIVARLRASRPTRNAWVGLIIDLTCLMLDPNPDSRPSAKSITSQLWWNSPVMFCSQCRSSLLAQDIAQNLSETIATSDWHGQHNDVPTPSPDDRDPPLPRSSSTMNVPFLNLALTSSTTSQDEVSKTFRVALDDPCFKVLPVALKKYNITSDWRDYALYIVHSDQARCLRLFERPLAVFRQLDNLGLKPLFMLREHPAPPEGYIITISKNEFQPINLQAEGVGWSN